MADPRAKSDISAAYLGLPTFRSKPLLLLDDVLLIKLFIRFGEVDDTFDQADETSDPEAATQKDRDDAGAGHSEHEFVDA